MSAPRPSIDIWNKQFKEMKSAREPQGVDTCHTRDRQMLDLCVGSACKSAWAANCVYDLKLLDFAAHILNNSS
jgi:hypothetical protein